MTTARTDLHGAADAELLALARAGNPEAFGILYERHVAAAQRLAYQLAAAPKLADDIVAEAFPRIQEVVVRGGGPSVAFRAYVLTAVRRVWYDRLRGTRGQPPPEPESLPDPDQLLVDPAFAGLETALMARAYQSLPERSRAVLWHTEIEQDSPGEVASLLGLTRNGVAALRRRAADDLRQAYLQMHITLITQPGCRPVAERLGAFNRRTLSPRDAALVSEHLTRCEGCQVVHAELTDIMASLRGVVAPLVLGPAAPGYLAGAGHRPAAVTGGASLSGGGSRSPAGASDGLPVGPPPGRDTALLPIPEASLLPGLDRFQDEPGAQQRSRRRSPRRSRLSRRAATAAAAGTVLAVTAAVTLAMALTGNDNTPASAGQRSPAPSRQAAVSQPSPSQTPSPQPSPSPSSSSPAPVAPPLQLTADLSVSGHGSFVDVMFQIANTSSWSSGSLTAAISLPAGSGLFSGDGHGGNHNNGSADGTALSFSGGWTCQPSSAGATCTHAALSAGQQAQGFLFVTISGSGACGQSVGLTVWSAGATVGASQAIHC